ncbi:heme biosynthesis protein HemY [Rhodomicrobium lacus]|uniref:heme biosynthesis protein HemY n=1 Tax=Rhodomicrobium lacus TaxID=2498452 RepID=UPI000F8EC657|nr:heme biosynthesis HemY N-terminal domain-containing protein [Rhodomicrobium lacus]
MTRLIGYFLLIVLVAVGFAWIADRPGSVTIQWLGYDIQTSVFIGSVALLLAFVIVFLLGWLGLLTWTGPKKFRNRVQRRRQRIGQEAVRRGIFAAGAGDKSAALKADAIARRTVPNEPLALLLQAQSAQLNEDSIASRQAFERMLEKPEMAELGLRGLYMEAKKANQNEAAKQFAERALAANPALSWSSSALFEIQTREGDWRAALKTLQIAKEHRHLAKPEADRRRSLLLTQLAIELEDSQPSKALAYATEAFDLSPTLIPAAVVAGRILTTQGQTSRATKILTQAWRSTQHPEIALTFAHARRGDSPRDRLARVKSLVAAGAQTLEGAVAVAVAAIDAQEWKTARLALEPYLANNPTARVCRLMARIEAGQNRDSGRAREWLAKAARGAPDPVWVASDGTISAEWQPISPTTGALGSFEWKTPPANATPTSEDFAAEISALDVVSLEGESLPDSYAKAKGLSGRSNEPVDVVASPVGKEGADPSKTPPTPANDTATSNALITTPETTVEAEEVTTPVDRFRRR